MFAINNEVSFYRGYFPYILLLLGPEKSFVIPRTLLYRGSLNRGSTVIFFYFTAKTLQGYSGTSIHERLRRLNC